MTLSPKNKALSSIASPLDVAHTPQRHNNKHPVDRECSGNTVTPTASAAVPPFVLAKNTRTNHIRSSTDQNSEKHRPLEKDYALMDAVGEGAFGQVRCAIHRVTKEEVAIKIIERCRLTTQRQRRNVERETRLMTLLKHPNIIPIREVRILPDRHIIVMKRATGGELFDLIIRSGRLDEETARGYFRQIVSAVRYCHEHSIIHRDLKPENMLLDATQKRLYLIDFGFGNTFRPNQLLRTFCGSPFYAAPEMLRGVPYIGPEVDVWSLGVVLYAMLTGRLPFDAREGKQLCARVCRGVFVVPDYVSADAASLLRCMLLVDPIKRATIQQVALHDWTVKGYQRPPQRTHSTRPTVVAQPSESSVRQLISYGFQRTEILNALQDTSMQGYPIPSLYHLCEDARQLRGAEMRFAHYNRAGGGWPSRRAASLDCLTGMALQHFTVSQSGSRADQAASLGLDDCHSTRAAATVMHRMSTAPARLPGAANSADANEKHKAQLLFGVKSRDIESARGRPFGGRRSRSMVKSTRDVKRNAMQREGLDCGNYAEPIRHLKDGIMEVSSSNVLLLYSLPKEPDDANPICTKNTSAAKRPAYKVRSRRTTSANQGAVALKQRGYNEHDAKRRGIPGAYATGATNTPAGRLTILYRYVVTKLQRVRRTRAGHMSSSSSYVSAPRVPSSSAPLSLFAAQPS